MDDQLLGLLERALEAGSLGSIGLLGLTWAYHFIRGRLALFEEQLDRIEEHLEALARSGAPEGEGE